MKNVRVVRLKLGISKTALAGETDALRAWMTERTVGRKESIAWLSLRGQKLRKRLILLGSESFDRELVTLATDLYSRIGNGRRNR